jgi:hypothetical protein
MDWIKKADQVMEAATSSMMDKLDEIASMPGVTDSDVRKYLNTHWGSDFAEAWVEFVEENK